MSDDCEHESTTTNQAGVEWCDDCGECSHGPEHRQDIRETDVR